MYKRQREITPPEEVPDLFAEEIPSYDGREAEVSKNTIPDDITICLLYTSRCV